MARKKVLKGRWMEWWSKYAGPKLCEEFESILEELGHAAAEALNEEGLTATQVEYTVRLIFSLCDPGTLTLSDFDDIDIELKPDEWYEFTVHDVMEEWGDLNEDPPQELCWVCARYYTFCKVVSIYTCAAEEEEYWKEEGNNESRVHGK